MTFSFLLHLQNGDCYAEACPERPTEIHHVDGNTHNWSPGNLRASCNTHNPKGLFSLSADSVNNKRERIPELNISYEAKRSLELGPTFEKELDRIMEESNLESHREAYGYFGVTVREAVDRLAGICGCDQQVSDRWVTRNTLPLDSSSRWTLSEKTISDGRKKRTAQFIVRKSTVRRMKEE